MTSATKEALQKLTPFNTKRLFLRPLQPNDAANLFEMEKQAQVHQYLLSKPMQTLQQAEDDLQNMAEQYQTWGIGRWAMVLRNTQSETCIGWAGLKWIHEPVGSYCHYLDLGYRLNPQFWNQGYATEAAQAWMNIVKSDPLLTAQTKAVTHINNIASQRIITGLGFVEDKHERIKTVRAIWYRIPA